jgi:branched-chain amino acid transport system ATP-binding protein/urea transport system ATP-binding protein
MSGTEAGRPLLATRGLTMRFGGVVAVNGVDFTLPRGETRCLIGPNGAGKSTFFKMLCGMLRPSAGSVFFDGVDIAGSERHTVARHGIGIKMQVPSVFDGLTVERNLMVAARRNRQGRPPQEVVEETIARIGLGAIAQRTVGQLAHGQRQWVELALLVAAAPRLLLLDEPVAGMSAEETGRTAELLQDLRRDLSLIVVDHDIRFIRMIGAPVTVFHRGRILLEGPAGSVLSDARVQDVYLGKRAAGHA